MPTYHVYCTRSQSKKCCGETLLRSAATEQLNSGRLTRSSSFNVTPQLIICSENLAIGLPCLDHGACALRSGQMNSSRLGYPLPTFLNVHGTCALFFRETTTFISGPQWQIFFLNFRIFRFVRTCYSVDRVVDPANDYDSRMKPMERKTHI